MVTKLLAQGMALNVFGDQLRDSGQIVMRRTHLVTIAYLWQKGLGGVQTVVARESTVFLSDSLDLQRDYHVKLDRHPTPSSTTIN
mgnify:CR=1 FL=1